MPTQPAWKTMERRVAKKLRGVRIWRPDFGEEAPDGSNEREIWDTKCYQRHAAVSLYVDCEKKYRQYANGKRFLLILFAREHPRAGDFVLLPLSQYVEDQELISELNDDLRFLQRRLDDIEEEQE